jgi:3-hydroxybutyryl-CoA dehydrogenase
VTEPSIERVQSILVVGSGAMGSQIGMVCALAGYDVAVQDIEQAMLGKGLQQLRGRMTRNVEEGRLRRDQVDAAFGRMIFTTDLEGAASEADFVIEAAVEKLDVKREIFRRLDDAAPEHASARSSRSSR